MSQTSNNDPIRFDSGLRGSRPRFSASPLTIAPATPWNKGNYGGQKIYVNFLALFNGACDSPFVARMECATNSHPNIMKTFFNNRRTGLVTSQPWGLFRCAGSRVLCSDGKIRALAYLAQTPDSFFSTPAAIRVRGKYITGYVTTEETSPESKGYKVRRAAHTFRQHDGQADGILPPWDTVGSDWSDEKHAFLAVACDEEPNT